MKISFNKNIFLLLLVFIIAIISYKVIFYNELWIDTVVSSFMNTIRCKPLDYIMKFITSFSNTATIIILLAVVLWLLVKMVKNKKLAIFFLVSIVCNVLINQSIKVLIKRQRPINSLIYVGGFSFPSGHAMISMAFYGMLIYIFYKLVDNKKLKKILIISFSLLIFLIGFSRIYLKVHYFSDVAVGFSISLLHLYIICKLLNKYKIFT